MDCILKMNGRTVMMGTYSECDARLWLMRESFDNTADDSSVLEIVRPVNGKLVSVFTCYGVDAVVTF